MLERRINTEGDPIKVSRSGSGICQSLSLTCSVYVGSCSNSLALTQLNLNYCLLCFLERVEKRERERHTDRIMISEVQWVLSNVAILG